MKRNIRNRTSKDRTRWYVLILVVLIPFFVFTVSLNASTRIADAYKWEMDRIQEQADSENPGDAKLLRELNIYVETDSLSSQISAFMKHKTNEIQTLDRNDEMYDYYLADAAEFSEMDYHALKVMRTIDDVLLVLGILSFVWAAMMFMYHIRDGYASKAAFRRIFLISVAVQFVCQAVLGALLMIAPVRASVSDVLFGIRFGEGDILPQIMGSNIVAAAGVLEIIICFAVTLVLFYIVWVSTKPRDVFNERRYFR